MPTLYRYEDVCKTEYDTVYDTVTEKKCETQYETEYTTESDTVCDTVYEQKCEVRSVHNIYIAKVAKICEHCGTFWDFSERFLVFLQGFFWGLFLRNMKALNAGKFVKR